MVHDWCTDPTLSSGGLVLTLSVKSHMTNVESSGMCQSQSCRDYILQFTSTTHYKQTESDTLINDEIKHHAMEQPIHQEITIVNVAGLYS